MGENSEKWDKISEILAAQQENETQSDGLSPWPNVGVSFRKHIYLQCSSCTYTLSPAVMEPMHPFFVEVDILESIHSCDDAIITV